MIVRKSAEEKTKQNTRRRINAPDEVLWALVDGLYARLPQYSGFVPLPSSFVQGNIRVLCRTATPRDFQQGYNTVKLGRYRGICHDFILKGEISMREIFLVIPYTFPGEDIVGMIVEVKED